MACLDTSILLDLAGRGGKRRRDRALAKLGELVDRGEPLLTTQFNVAELYVGVHRSSEPIREERGVRALLADLGVLEFRGDAALLFAKLTAHLQQTGRPAGDMDVLIASVAIAAGQRLVTDNVRHFAGIPYLEVEAY